MDGKHNATKRRAETRVSGLGDAWMNEQSLSHAAVRHARLAEPAAERSWKHIGAEYPQDPATIAATLATDAPIDGTAARLRLVEDVRILASISPLQPLRPRSARWSFGEQGGTTHRRTNQHNQHKRREHHGQPEETDGNHDQPSRRRGLAADRQFR
jgi:hypothetical protein